MTRSSDATRAGCVDPDALAAVAEGRAGEEARLAALDHVGRCAACRADLDLIRAAVAAGRRVGLRQMPPLALAASIAALVVAGTLWLAWPVGRGEPDAGLVRGPARDVALIAPAGPPERTLLVSPPVRLVWHALAEAVRYDVEVLDGGGGPVYAVTTTDTMVTVPDSVTLVSDTEYRWWVRAVVAGGIQRRSQVARFRLDNP